MKNNDLNGATQMWPLSLVILASACLTIASGTAVAQKIGRPVEVVSLCFRDQGFEKIIKMVEEEASKGVDIISLPETWRGQHTPEKIDGETITALSRIAKQYKTYILSPIDRTDGKGRYNTAVLIDRQGKVVFGYDKIYPYWAEFDLSEGAVNPGSNGEMVYDTDFGRIGVSICFDSNFPEVWQALRDKGAEIVFWPSAYSAGSQLQAYAIMHHYYIVTSTYTKDCQVYDITGERILDAKSADVTVARTTVDLDRVIFHENFNMQKRDKLLKEHKDEIEQEAFLEREQWFVLRSKKPGISARELTKKYEMEELVDYQDRSRREIDKRRGRDLPKKQL
ncbi:MAG TPA: carbon-nitrogen hydrolase family protein [Chryseolinea sp.]|nr:carbon-nitrogen hydrolase family protein [Chryseolinea sp.]